MRAYFIPLAIGLALIAGQAVAQEAAPTSSCAPYETAVAALGSKFHEAPVARMLADGPNGHPGFVIEILASADGETFTVLGVQANGTACLLATGSAFAFVTGADAPKPGVGS